MSNIEYILDDSMPCFDLIYLHNWSDFTVGPWYKWRQYWGRRGLANFWQKEGRLRDLYAKNSDRGGGCQKFKKFSWRHLYMTPWLASMGILGAHSDILSARKETVKTKHILLKIMTSWLF